MNSIPKIEYRKAHSYAAVQMQVAIPFGKYLQPAWSKIHNWLTEQGISHGPAIIRYLTTNMSRKLDIEVGFSIDQIIPAAGGIKVDELPAGHYATLLYTGSYKGKGVFKANVAIIEWAKANNVTWNTSIIDGREWWASRIEWYFNTPGNDPNSQSYQTELTFMVADRKK